MSKIISQTDQVIEVDTTHIACDGGGTLGHPKVYYELGEEGAVTCGYCDRRFVLKPISGSKAG